MNERKILERFCSLAALDREQAIRHMHLIRLAAAEVKAALKEGVLPKKEEERLIYLCAAISYYRYILETGIDAAGEVRVADVQIKPAFSSRLSLAQKLKSEALIAAKDFIKDPDFFFGGMA